MCRVVSCINALLSLVCSCLMVQKSRKPSLWYQVQRPGRYMMLRRHGGLTIGVGSQKN
jgi:hypothetical protein